MRGLWNELTSTVEREPRYSEAGLESYAGDVQARQLALIQAARAEAADYFPSDLICLAEQIGDDLFVSLDGAERQALDGGFCDLLTTEQVVEALAAMCREAA